MRSNKSSIVLIILGSLAALLLGWIFYASIEFYEDTEQSAWSHEAIRNPYLAAQQFMQQSDINAVETDSLLGLNNLDSVSTVLITDANQVINSRQLEQVLEWLEKGGTLIVTANFLSTSEDLLLDEFNVNVEWPSNPDDGEEDEISISETMREFNQQIDEGKTVEEISSNLANKAELTTIDFGEDIGVLEIAFRKNRVLTHPYIDGDQEEGIGPQPFSWSYSDYGIHMMQFDVGSGLLTIISDPTIWASSRIKDHDHAYLLWVLSGIDGDFAILHPSEGDSLWQLTLDRALELMVALAFFIGFWLWYQGHRFGRILPRYNSSSRALGEHFSATANYLWHRKASDELLDPVRQQIKRRASIVLPGFAMAGKDPDRQLHLLSRHCGLEVTTVDLAMNTSQFNENSFVRTVKLLKYIEQSL